MNTDIVERASIIAIEAHGDDKRKGDGSPYISHPFRVALYLAMAGFKDDVIAAALVHDVLEDTKYSADLLEKNLSLEVMEMVQAVTQDDKLDWKEKKLRYIQTVKSGNEGAKAISTADKIINMRDLFLIYEKEGPIIWDRFNKGRSEKLWFELEMLRMLEENWNHAMVLEYRGLVERMKKLT